MTGSAGQKRVPKTFLEEYKVDLPSLDIQKATVAILDKVSGLIALRKQQLAKLDELVKSRFIELFGDPVSNPMGWKKQKLINVCTKLNDGTHFSPESFEIGDYKYVTAKNIKLNGFDFSNITMFQKRFIVLFMKGAIPNTGMFFI